MTFRPHSFFRGTPFDFGGLDSRPDEVSLKPKKVCIRANESL